MAEIYKSKFPGQEIDERLELIPELQEGVEAAQQAADGKYTKPASGIPMTDLSDEVREAIEEGGGQADWAQTDTTAPDYIKNKPSIPTHVVRFVQQFLSDSERIQARANIGAGTYTKPSGGIPESDLADDVVPDVSDFITNTVNNLVNYYLKSETYSRSEVQQLIAAIQGVSFVSVASLPTPSADTMGGKIYLVPSANPDEQNVKDEFITIQDGNTYTWEQIGSTAVNLSGYVTTQQLNNALVAYTTTEALTTLLAAKQDTISDLSAIRSGAAAGATAYQKPQTGIPASDLAPGVIPTVPTDVVKYSSQSLTDAQKAQARTNIGAAAASALTALETAIAAKYTKPSSGIPETDLAANVQSALALARTSIQSLADYYDKTEIDSLLAAVSSEQYVDVATLPTASASTLGKIYLVGPTNGVYDRYYTSYDGTTYSWVGVGTTEINLANYATKAELNQLSQKVDDINGAVKPFSQMEKQNWWLNTSQIQSRNDCQCVVLPVNGGESVKLVIGTATAYYYVTTSLPTPGVAPNWATGYSARSQMVAAQSPQIFTLPEDARYIILSTLWFGNDNTPSQVIIDDVDYVQGRDGIAKRVDDLGEEVKTKATVSRIAENLINAMYGNGFAKSTNPDGSAHFVSQANITGYKGVSLGVSETPKANTDYFLIVDVKVTADILASDGMGRFVLKLVGGGNFNSTYYKVGNRSVVWAKVSAASPTGAFIQLSDTPPGTWPEGAVTFDIYHCALVEAKDYAAEDMVAALVELGWPTTMDGVPVSDYAIRQVHFPAIDAWGDSLTAATFGYTAALARISGLTVNMHAYGGKTSQYIRNQFEQNYNPNNFNIFWLGRNNYTQPESILDDLKAMIAKLNKPNYLIVMPPNGGYGYFNGALGELKGGTAYEKFLEIEKLLSSAFGNHFVNIRRAVIERWSQGVTLLSSFVQPSVGGTVQIAVSDANKLITYNTFDTEYQGESFMKKIVIGINGQYDIYTVLSKVDDTHLSVSLDESHRVAPGGTVGNVAETDYTLMLRVEQYADYMFRAYDSTLSTYRADGVHPSAGGRTLNAEIIYDALRLFM